MLRSGARQLTGVRSDTVSIQEQFDVIVVAYEKRVYNIAFRMLGDHDDAADVTQEAFIKAYRAWGSFRGDSSVYTWLYRIITNCCKNRLKDRERPARYGIDSLDSLRSDGSTEDTEIPDWRYSPEPALERQELRDVVHQAIQALPSDYRIVIILRDLQGLSYKEIGTIIGAPLETVKTRIFRGRGMLREKLASYVAD